MLAGPFTAPAGSAGVTPSTTTLSSSSPGTPPTSVVGDPVTYTALVAGGAGTPTGTVAFTDGGSSIGCDTQPVDGSGNATCLVTYTSVAGSPHAIAANYSGDPTYDVSSDTLNQTVNPADPTFTLSSSPNPSDITQQVTYTATVSGNGDNPTGRVDYFDGGTEILGCHGTLVTVGTGVAQCNRTYNSASGSPHHVTATYNGDANYNSANSNPVDQVVHSGAASTTTLLSDNNPANVNQTVTYTATIGGAGAPPTGTVDFTDGGSPIGGCTGVAVNGSLQAACTKSYPSTAGSPHPIRADYSGDGTYGGSFDTLTENVTALGSNTSLGSSLNPSQVGDAVTYTATVSGSGPTPTGTVDFSDGASVICNNVAMSGGQAQCAKTFLSPGSHSMTADYSGDSAYSGSTSGTVTQVVNQNGSSIALSPSANPGTAGQQVTYTATITVSATGPNPGGTVDFSDGGTPIGACQSRPVNGGSGNATCNQTYNSVGSHAITAVYSGDANYVGSSTPSPLNESVIAAGPSSLSATASSTPQQVEVGSAFPVPVGVLVQDQFNNPVPGVTVNFTRTVAGTGATGFFPSNQVAASIQTDVNGVAALTVTANFQSGAYTAKADVPGVGHVTFDLTNLAGGPGTLAVVGGDQQSATVLHGYASLLTVRVFDGHSNPVPDVNVTFQSPAGGATGTFSNGTTAITVKTDANGSAWTAITANSVGGSFFVNAAAGTGVSNKFTLTNVATPPGAPSFVSASSFENVITIVWGQPVYDGGSPVTSYTITLLPFNVKISAPSTARSFQLRFFLNGTNVSVTVAANNGAGAGASSPPATVFVVRPGYWMAASDGGVFNFGVTQYWGSTGGMHLNRPIVGMGVTITGNGYWLVASDGGIFSFGQDARFLGSTGAIHLNQPIVGMSVTPTGKGYWLVASDGGIFAFGDARYFGSTGNIHLNRPIVGMSVTPSGKGYWLVASDGGIFAFGDARFLGSTGAIRLNRPIVGMTTTAGGTGYWLVASDGGIFAFGDARFYGSTGNIHLNRPIVGMASSPTGRGYWMVASDGGIFSFGDAIFYGSTGTIHLNQPIIGMGTQPITHF